MSRRLSLSLVSALLLVSAQAAAVLGAANETHASCIAGFTTNQEPGGVADSILGNLEEAHPIGLTVISFTAVTKPPCFEEE
jgi:hypothetical protein